MKTEDFLRTVTALPGVTGNEGQAAEYIAEAFRPFADEVTVTPLNCVIARQKGPGPKVMICAHLDEIGMMVSQIEADGALRLRRVGGVDPRILPGMRVRVYAREGVMTGVVGVPAPSQLTEQQEKENYTFDNLFVDMGLPADEVRRRVRVGDTVCFEARYVPLKNGQAATKTADDRACVAILLRTAEITRTLPHEADLYYVATCQEEIGSFGAQVTSFAIDPDYGVAFDVCHAETPDAPKSKTSKIESLVVSKGPFLNPFLVKKLEETAKEHNVALQTEIDPRRTATDEDTLSLCRAGVPSVLLSLPLKYMHTNVETFDMHALTEGSRLLAQYLASVSGDWEDALWN